LPRLSGQAGDDDLDLVWRGTFQQVGEASDFLEPP
jgi:hypothetical protein